MDSHRAIQIALIADIEGRDIAPTSVCAWLIERGWKEHPVAGQSGSTRAFATPLATPEAYQGVVRVSMDPSDQWYMQELLDAIAKAAVVRHQSFIEALDSLTAFAHRGEKAS